MTGMERTLPTAKGQRWPLSTNSRVQRWLDVHRDQQPIKLICGLDGCQHKVLGRFIEARLKLELHRKDEHPEWVPVKPKRYLRSGSQQG